MKKALLILLLSMPLQATELRKPTAEEAEKHRPRMKKEREMFFKEAEGARAYRLKMREKRLKARAKKAQVGASNGGGAGLDATFKQGEVYGYPNPAQGRNPIFHVESGLADEVTISVYDVAGNAMHEATLTNVIIVNDGQGAQYAYEHEWDTRNVGSGVYRYVVKARKGRETWRATGKQAVVK